MIKHAIFDLDNTLYYYDPVDKIAFEKLTESGSKILKVEQKEFQNAYLIGKGKIKERLPDSASGHNRLLYIENALEYLGFTPAKYALDLYEIYWGTFLDNMILRNGALELLDYLKKRKIRICLCSDLTAHIQYRKIKKLGLENYFSYIVTSEETGADKPNEKMFQLSLEKLNAKSEETIFIGDDLYKDIYGAEKAGLCALRVDNMASDPFGTLFSEIKNKIERTIK